MLRVGDFSKATSQVRSVSELGSWGAIILQKLVQGRDRRTPSAQLWSARAVAAEPTALSLGRMARWCFQVRRS